MDFSTIGKRVGRNDDPDARAHLAFLLAAAGEWRKLDKQIAPLLPANLRPHVRTACLENGCLVLLAANNITASRMKMLAPALLPRLNALNSHIRDVRIKLSPKPDIPPKTNRLALSGETAAQFRHTADRLAHHPQLAERLRRLAGRHQK
ncbi:DciA family protein [Neisseria leonii]|uniref:DUF721 domain-containing protein n=1 Tax=Neisseria leonii TaxID=2995413 RepID=A0A9X4E421_9NEIS|nr:DciA family protein [Neisseria sp. 51.81]MDD9327601.1 DUF721 domain-containing protein [Neisseria sp. 51.81]